MAQLLTLTTHSCERGDLTVFERVLPGPLQQVFYITNANGNAWGGHQHYTAWQALVCIRGSVSVQVETGHRSDSYSLTKPNQCLVLEPGDWYKPENFGAETIVLVASDVAYDATDYLQERVRVSGNAY